LTTSVNGFPPTAKNRAGVIFFFAKYFFLDQTGPREPVLSAVRPEFLLSLFSNARYIDKGLMQHASYRLLGIVTFAQFVSPSGS
jgi:hypothetical protein